MMSTPKRTVLNVTSLKNDGKKPQHQNDEESIHDSNSQPLSQEWANNRPPQPTHEGPENAPPPPTQECPQSSHPQPTT